MKRPDLEFRKGAARWALLIGVVLAAALVPSLASGVELLAPDLLPAYDLTPFSFAVTAFAVAWSIPYLRSGSAARVLRTAAADVVGEVLLRARPLVAAAGQEVRGGSTSVWVTPGPRLVVDLTQPVAYDYSAEASQVVLTLAGGSQGATSAAAPMAGGPAVTGIDFRLGENGQAKVIVNTNRAGASMSVQEKPDGLTVDLFGASLPESLDQRLDVTDFATPVQFIDSLGVASGVRLELKTYGLYEHMTYESGNEFVIEVSQMSQAVQAAEEEVVKFFEEKTYEGTRVTFNFQDIPVRSVLQLIADVSDLNIVVADSVGGNLTLRLTNVPWDQALDIVMDARNLDMRKNGNVLWIGPTAEIAAREQQLLQAQADRRVLEPLQTVLIPVSYAKAEDLATLITESTGSVETEYGLLSERGSVTVDSRTNTLLVTDTAEKILEIRDLVAELDYAVQQVQIESRIVIASSDFAHELGVRFGVTALHLGSNIGVIAADGFAADTVNPAINPRDDGLLDIPSYPSRYQVNLPASSQNASTLGLSFLTGDVILDLELSALESEGEGEVISTPRVITANQAEAFIQQGVEIPYENSTSSGATAVQFKEAVLELRVTPLITPDNRVQIDLNVKQDTVGEIYQTARGGSVPSIDTRELETTVLVANGERELEIREVTVARAEPRFVYLADGIEDGELIVTTALDAPIPGTKLAVRGEEPVAAADDAAVEGGAEE